MSYIDKEKLIKADIASIENRVRHAFNQGYDLGFKDGKERAKPQEPILDKIRAEIQENIDYNKKMNYQGIVAGLLLTRDIIDKYKAEIEPQESEDKK